MRSSWFDDPRSGVEDDRMRHIDLEALSPKTEDGSKVRVVIEAPAGSRNKYKYDRDLGMFLLHKILPAGSAFPFDFGFVPGTLAQDDDPLDVMVLGEEATFTGCVVTVRLLGVIGAKQKDKGKTVRNDRLLATPVGEKIKPSPPHASCARRPQSRSDRAGGVLAEVPGASAPMGPELAGSWHFSPASSPASRKPTSNLGVSDIIETVSQ